MVIDQNILKIGPKNQFGTKFFFVSIAMNYWNYIDSQSFWAFLYTWNQTDAHLKFLGALLN
jgi:hypothetical protein